MNRLRSLRWGSSRRGSSAWRKFWLVLFLVVLPLLAGVAIGGLYAFARTVPSIAELKQDVIPPGTKIYADDDVLIGELKVRKGQYVPLKEMPPALINAVIAIEDSKFWKHSGVDYIAILRAAAIDIMQRKLKQGASTITQQLAKITFLTPERTFKRKLKEFILAHRIEKNLTKQEILEFYLNRAYFGHGAYGVEMASQVYFEKPAAELTTSECAVIAGLLKSPANYSPFNDLKRARDRQESVLKRMEDEGLLSRQQMLTAVKAPLYLSTRRGVANDPNNYFVDYIKDYVEEKYGSDLVYKSGMNVYTTLDRQGQRIAHEAMSKGLRELDKRRGFRGPLGHVDLGAEDAAGESERQVYRTKPLGVGDILRGVVLKVDRNEVTLKADNLTGKLGIEDARWAASYYDEAVQEIKTKDRFDLTKIFKRGDIIKVQVKAMSRDRVEFRLEQDPLIQGSLVSLETTTGYVRAMVGGYDYGLSQFNRAVKSKRQAGSSFKPVVYALAMRNGFTPASIVIDEEVQFKDSKDQAPEEIYVPKNYDETFYGPTRLRKALALSRNIITLKLAESIGVGRIIEFSKKLGVTSPMQRDITVALGSTSFSPLELTSVYGVFANKGVRMEPLAVKYITDRRGRVLETREPKGEPVLDPQSAFLITSMLEEVVQHGTGWRAKALRRPTAAKTGTTNEYKDAWFIGYTTDLVTGVWVGFDDPKPLGQDETGSRAAAPIWVDYMVTRPAESEALDFERPAGITTRMIDPDSGLLANEWTKGPLLEYFLEGTEPKEEAKTIWNVEEANPFEK